MSAHQIPAPGASLTETTSGLKRPGYRDTLELRADAVKLPLLCLITHEVRVATARWGVGGRQKQAPDQSGYFVAGVRSRGGAVPTPTPAPTPGF